MMRLRSLALSTLLLFACTTAAFAAKPAPEIVPLEGDFQSITSGHPAPNGACTMGVTDAPAFIINYIVPPNDQYYTLIDPSNCSCPNGSIAVNAAHVLLNFQAACAQPVAVTIVPAVDVNGCLQPDPSAPICGPFLFNLTPGAAGNFQFNLPIPQGCCITQKAFLGINFVSSGVGCSTSATRPRLITTASCAPCTSWNLYPPSGFDDLCVDAGFPGNPAMWADGDCCNVTPAARSSWGEVKNLYR